MFFCALCIRLKAAEEKADNASAIEALARNSRDLDIFRFRVKTSLDYLRKTKPMPAGFWDAVEKEVDFGEYQALVSKRISEEFEETEIRELSTVYNDPIELEVYNAVVAVANKKKGKEFGEALGEIYVQYGVKAVTKASKFALSQANKKYVAAKLISDDEEEKMHHKILFEASERIRSTWK
jgi:hypothetical protein